MPKLFYRARDASAGALVSLCLYILSILFIRSKVILKKGREKFKTARLNFDYDLSLFLTSLTLMASILHNNIYNAIIYT